MSGFFESIGGLFSSDSSPGRSENVRGKKRGSSDTSGAIVITPQDALLTHMLLVHALKDALLRVIALATRNVSAACRDRRRTLSISSSDSNSVFENVEFLNESMTPAKHLIDILSACLWHGLKNTAGSGSGTPLPSEERHFWKVLESLGSNPDLDYQKREAYKASVMLVKLNSKCTTPHGLCKAWLRQVINQDALKMNLEGFISSEAVLKENYESWAFMRCLCEMHRYHGSESDLKSVFLTLLDSLQGIGFALNVSNTSLDFRAPVVPGAVLTPNIVEYHILIETCLANMMPEESLAKTYNASTVLVSGCGNEVDAEGRYLCIDIDDEGRPVFFNKTTGFKLICSPYWSIYSSSKKKIFTTNANDREPPRIGWRQVETEHEEVQNSESDSISGSTFMIVLSRLRYAAGLSVALHVTPKSPVDKRRLASDELASLMIEQHRVTSKRRALDSIRERLLEQNQREWDNNPTNKQITETFIEGKGIDTASDSAKTDANMNSDLVANPDPPELHVTKTKTFVDGTTLTSFVKPESESCDVNTKPIKVISVKSKTRSKSKVKRSKNKTLKRVKSRDACIVEPGQKVTDYKVSLIEDTLADVALTSTDDIASVSNREHKIKKKRNKNIKQAVNRLVAILEDSENTDTEYDLINAGQNKRVPENKVCDKRKYSNNANSLVENSEKNDVNGRPFLDSNRDNNLEESLHFNGDINSHDSTKDTFTESLDEQQILVTGSEVSVGNVSEGNILGKCSHTVEEYPNKVHDEDESATHIAQPDQTTLKTDSDIGYDSDNETSQQAESSCTMKDMTNNELRNDISISSENDVFMEKESSLKDTIMGETGSDVKILTENNLIMEHASNETVPLYAENVSGKVVEEENVQESLLKVGSHLIKRGGVFDETSDEKSVDLQEEEEEGASLTSENISQKSSESLSIVSKQVNGFVNGEVDSDAEESFSASPVSKSKEKKTSSWDSLKDIGERSLSRSMNKSISLNVDANDLMSSEDIIAEVGNENITQSAKLQRTQSKTMLLYMIRTYAAIEDIYSEEAKSLAAAIHVITNGYVVGPFSEQSEASLTDAKSLATPDNPSTPGVDVDTGEATGESIVDVEITGHKIFNQKGNTHVRYIIRSKINRGRNESAAGGDDCWLNSNVGNDASIIRNGERRMSNEKGSSMDSKIDTVIVHRRFNEFKEMYEKLSVKYPKVPLPSLPRTSFRRRFGNNYIEKKGGSLHSFLVELIKVETSPSWNNASTLASDEIVVNFLTTIPDDYLSLFRDRSGSGGENNEAKMVAALAPRPAISEGLHVSLVLEERPDSRKIEAKGTDDDSQCAACGISLSSSHWRSGPRFCHYLEKWFCKACFTGTGGAGGNYTTMDSCTDEYTIPSILLHQWKVVKLPVCHLVVEYLENVRKHPLICASSVNPELYGKEFSLATARKLRLQLVLGREHLACQRSFSEVVPLLSGDEVYLSQDTEIYSLDDLEKACNGELVELLTDAVNEMLSHINTCARCSASGFVCELCEDDLPIYPFQVDTVIECRGCKGFYHRDCFVEAGEESCPQCIRRQDRISKQFFQD